MRLYNTLTRQIDDLVTQNPGQVKVYTCGPTVYDYSHIGHWFTYVRMDILIRALRLDNYSVDWLMNITDVGHLISDADDGEDKLEKGARREGKTAWEVAEFYTKDFIEGMKHLGMLSPDRFVKATDHISDQIALIETLEQKGYAYKIDDGMYYDTGKFPGYASFARLDLDEQQAGARVEVNTQKRNSSDFALWKFSPEGSSRDMEWDSPWGKGFPGWHIECSAMSMKYLGDTLDIHTGGIDHIPVHHTNEIAQSEAATGKRFANYWMHSNHVTVNGEKISKSSGNGIRIQDIIDRGIPAAAIRLHILESHYRSQSRFSWESLEAAHNRLKGFYSVSVLVHQIPPAVLNPVTQEEFKHARDAISQALLDDLKTSDALIVLNQISEQLLLRSPGSLKDLIEFLHFVDETLGLDLSNQADITDEQKAKILGRETARESKDWELSDSLRNELMNQGILLSDTGNKTIWSRS